jgi:hypothetical protein
VAWKVNVAFLESSVHGTGVFARERIRKGTKIWEYDDSMFVESRKQMEKMDGKYLPYVLKAGYLHRTSGKFLWYTDGMQFINHATDANVGLDYWPRLEQDHIVALRDIAPGEELCEDYGMCLAGGLAPDHWLRPLYLAHCRGHYEFLLDLAQRAAPARPSDLGRNSRTVAINASIMTGFEITARNPDAKHAA